MSQPIKSGAYYCRACLLHARALVERMNGACPRCKNAHGEEALPGLLIEAVRAIEPKAASAPQPLTREGFLDKWSLRVKTKDLAEHAAMLAEMMLDLDLLVSEILSDLATGIERTYSSYERASTVVESIRSEAAVWRKPS